MARTMRRARDALALLAVIGSLMWPGAVPASAGTTPADYVALGDSYSAGLGAPTQDLDPACRRSPQSYPSLWAAEHRSTGLSLVACSGARTTDVIANQVRALQPGTSLVTITIGGNDAGFAPVVQACTLASSDPACAAVVSIAQIFVLFALPELLARAFDAIRRAAPRAQVIVLGYPRLFDLAPRCTEPLTPNLARRAKLNEGADLLDTVIQAVSGRFGFSFADVRDRFAGHGVCSADPWIIGPTAPASVGRYHPTPTGYDNGYLTALNTAIIST